MTKAQKIALRARLGDLVRRDIHYTNWRIEAIRKGTSQVGPKSGKPTVNPQADQRYIIRKGYLIDKATLTVICRVGENL